MSPHTTRLKKKFSLSNGAKKVMNTAKTESVPKKATTKSKPARGLRLKLPRLRKILPKVKPAQKRQLKLTEADLINAESALGGTIFGPIPVGHRREFFLFKPNTWVFHEAWERDGKRLETTITYKVEKHGVFKSPLGSEYVKITGAELENFVAAAREYIKIVKSKLY